MLPTAPASPRAARRTNTSPLAAGLPDPRPLTEYTAVYEEVGGKSRITVILDSPCIIREPVWGFVNCDDGSVITAPSPGKPVLGSNTTFVFSFDDIISGRIALVDVPYQDMQVQNFQGGFVRPGGQWFRRPE